MTQHNASIHQRRYLHLDHLSGTISHTESTREHCSLKSDVVPLLTELTFTFLDDPLVDSEHSGEV